MTQNFNYQQAPKNYTYCLNKRCKRTDNCLRFQASFHIGQNNPSFRIINSGYLINKEECPFFQPDKLIRFASGINDLLNKLPHLKSLRIKELLQKRFGMTKYYRIAREERLISPQEQEMIKRIFEEEGIEKAPEFSRYIDIYDWNS